MLKYLKEHVIKIVGFTEDDQGLLVEVISDNAELFISYILENGGVISEIRWWDRALILEKSKIGYGGHPDPRDPQKYYFAETDICASFQKDSTITEYCDYLNAVKEKYATYDLYPGLDIRIK